jgi:predicted nucleic acid-binding protein
MSLIYLDTSALLKRYVPERNSDAFDTWFAERAPASISRLTLVELRSGLARKRREGKLDAAQEQAATNEIRTDLQDGVIIIHPSSDADFVGAYHMIEALPELPLRTLDALHLAIAKALGSTELATADDVMRRAAQSLGISVVYFGNAT